MIVIYGLSVNLAYRDQKEANKADQSDRREDACYGTVVRPDIQKAIDEKHLISVCFPQEMV